MARFTPNNTSAVTGPVTVLLNGREQNLCSYADTTAGVIRVAVTDKDGNIILDKHRKRVREKTMRGGVQVLDVDGKEFRAAIDHRYRYDSPHRKRMRRKARGF